MTNLENIDEFQQEKINLILKSCEELDRNVNSLKLIADNLQKSSIEIVRHILSGNLEDQERNRELWHGLNNIEHQLNQFAAYTTSTTNNFLAESLKLLEKLSSLRPPREN